MKTNKIGSLFIISLLALAGIGISYAGFTDTITIFGTVTSGTVDIEVVEYSGTWVWKVWAVEEGAQPPIFERFIFRGSTDEKPTDDEVRNMFPGCDVSLIAFANAQDGSMHDGIEYDVDMIWDNIYPGIEFTADVIIEQVGSIPCRLQLPEIVWHEGEEFFSEYIIIQAYSYSLVNDDLIKGEEILSWPYQIHNGDFVGIDVTIAIPQLNELQGRYGEFSFDLNVIQWDEEWETPEPPVVEIDMFPASVIELELMLPTGESYQVMLTGPSEMHVFFEGPLEGDALDDDGDGLDEVETELVSLSLTGSDSVLGPISIMESSSFESSGEIEETNNLDPGVLNLAPFTGGSFPADSFFDVFVEIEVDGSRFVTDQPILIQGVISHKPPNTGEYYENIEEVELIDYVTGEGTGIFIVSLKYYPSGAYTIEVDMFDFSVSDVTLYTPIGSELIDFSGQALQYVFFEGSTDGVAGDDNGDGLDEVATELVELDLVGTSALVGPIILRVHPSITSHGIIEEIINTNPGTLDVEPFTTSGVADSFFDVFYEVEILGELYYSIDPMTILTQIHHKPPAPTDIYHDPTETIIPLYTSTGDSTELAIQMMDLGG